MQWPSADERFFSLSGKLEMAYRNHPFNFFISRALILVARIGIRVEIFTRLPILVATGREPLKAEVGKVRI